MNKIHTQRHFETTIFHSIKLEKTFTLQKVKTVIQSDSDSTIHQFFCQIRKPTLKVQCQLLYLLNFGRIPVGLINFNDTYNPKNGI